MTEKPIIEKEERTKAEELTLKELEAQVGGLLPRRIEMRRRRRHHGGSHGAACNGIGGCIGIDIL